MPRLILHDATGPAEIPPSDKSSWVCMCGLSKNKPYCDGSHALARKNELPDKLYRYQGDQPTEVSE